jgi:hypothetical protein
MMTEPVIFRPLANDAASNLRNGWIFSKRLQVSRSRLAHPFHLFRKVSIPFMNMRRTLLLVLAFLLLAAPAAQGQFKYTTANGSITITAYSGSADAVTIPSTINNLPVTSIGVSAFSGCISVASVTIPDSVTRIESSAFVDCESLTNLTIGNGVTSIGLSAFSGCTSLASVTIPNSVTGIGVFAFATCISLASVTIPNSTTTIGTEAFAGCSSLTNVTLGNGVTSIGVSPFSGCQELTAITVNSSNPAYISVAGVLFDRSETTLIEYPEAKTGMSYAVPNSVTNIGDLAFDFCTSVARLTIPSSVTDIGGDEFAGCVSLTNVTCEGNAPIADATIATAGGGASNLTVYYYPGTSGWGSTFDGIPAVMLNPPIPAGSLQVIITPAGVITSGARWQVDGGVPQPSRATALGLSVGNHTVSFTNISGWSTPISQIVMVIANQTTSAKGVYTVQEGGKPSLTVTSPKSGQNVSNALLQATGTVSDSVAVDDVYYQLNGGSRILATPGNSWNNWTASVTLNPGPNTISAYAQDAGGTFSRTNTVKFQFIPSTKLVVFTNGNGTFTPKDNGALLAIGTNYTLTAKPGNNWIFSNWVGGTTLPYALLSTENSYTFTMQSNLVLSANFVANPFIPEQGAFNGLFLDTNNVTEASSGFFTLNLTTTGAFTGRIMTYGSTYSLPTTKKFDLGGQVQFTIPAKQNTLTFNLQLNINDPASQQITGTVSDGSWIAALTADRAAFSASANKAVNYEGQYTLAIAGNDDAAASPGGFGWATISIGPSGTITMTGDLADGTTIGQSSVSVSKDGRWPFYASYASPPVGNGGAVISWITFSNEPASALGGTMYWFRPAGKVPAVYQSGFTNLMVPVIGSAYHPTAKPLLALTNGQVTLDGGNLLLPLTNQITMAASNIISVPVAPESTNKLKLTINKTAGAISGIFVNPSNSKDTIKVTGVLLQNQTNAAGYFLGTNQSGAFLLENQ